MPTPPSAAAPHRIPPRASQRSGSISRQRFCFVSAKEKPNVIDCFVVWASGWRSASVTSLVVWWSAGQRGPDGVLMGGPSVAVGPFLMMCMEDRNICCTPRQPFQKKKLWKWGTRKCRLLRAQKANRCLKGPWLGLKLRHFVCRRKMRRNHLFALAGKKGSTFRSCSVFEQNAGYVWVGGSSWCNYSSNNNDTNAPGIDNNDDNKIQWKNNKNNRIGLWLE